MSMLPPTTPQYARSHQDKLRTQPLTTDYANGYANINWSSKGDLSTLDVLAAKTNKQQRVYCVCKKGTTN